MIEQVLEAFEPLWTTLLAAASRLAPRIAAAFLLIVVAWALAKFVRWTMRRAAGFAWLEGLLLRFGILSGLVEPSLAESRRRLTNWIYGCILLVGVASALSVVSDSVAKQLAAFLIVLLPNLLLAAAIVIAAWWLGSYCARSILIWMANEGVPHPWRWSAIVRIFVLGAGVTLASESTGFATALFRGSFLILLAGVTFAAAQAAVPLVKSYLEVLFSPDRKRREPLDDRLLR